MSSTSDVRAGALIIHGFTSTAESMRSVADAVAEAGYEVELPLLPGHGTHWQDLAATPAEAMLSAVSDAYDRLSERSDVVVPVGLSMGGALALWVGAQKKAAGVVVINPGLRLRRGTGTIARFVSRVKPTIAPLAGDIAKPGVTEEAYEVTPLRAVWQLDRLFSRARSALPQLAAADIPVMLLRSPIDKVVGSSSAELLKRTVPQTREVILRRSRHVAPLDHDAELVGRRTVQFIAAAASEEMRAR